MNVTFTNLQDLVKNNTKYIEIIKNKYLYLLSMLTIVNSIDTKKFIDNVDKIHENGIIYIAYIGNIDDFTFEIVASGTIFIEQKLIHNLQSVGHIEDIVVHKEYRKNGLSKNIIDNLVEYAKNKNCYKVILDCSEKIIQVYKNCNFEKKGIQMSMYF